MGDVVSELVKYYHSQTEFGEGGVCEASKVSAPTEDPELNRQPVPLRAVFLLNQLVEVLHYQVRQGWGWGH